MKMFKHISAPQAKTMIAQSETYIVDIRDKLSFTQGHIEQALLLDNTTIDQFIDTADKDRAVLVYCYHGNSSQGAANFLAEKGFNNVYSLDGGYEAW